MAPYIFGIVIGIIVSGMADASRSTFVIGIALGVLWAQAWRLKNRVAALEARQVRRANAEEKITESSAPTSAPQMPTEPLVSPFRVPAPAQKPSIPAHLQDMGDLDESEAARPTSPNAPPVAPQPLSQAPRLQPALQTPQKVSAPKPSPDPIVAAIKSFFSTNAIAKVGVIILFFGVAFLLKYVSDQGLLPIEFRLFGAALGSLALVGLGWRLRGKNKTFSLIIQGGGVGIFYLTVFAAFRMYALLPPFFAFALLVACAVFSSALAVLQDSRALAVLSSAGGFLAPVLASTGGGSHVALFSYYAILNFGILGIAWFKTWRPLNVVGFAFTFVISSLWAEKYYQPSFFSTVEPFLIIFFLVYFFVGALFAIKKRTEGVNSIDGFLIYGVPFLTFLQQCALVHNFEYGIAISCVALGAFYVVSGRILYSKLQDELKYLVLSYLGIGAAFLTTAVPYFGSDRQTSAIWALEGAALLWVGAQQRSQLMKLFGFVVQILAGWAFLAANNDRFEGPPLFNVFYGGILVLFGSYMVSSYLLFKEDERQKSDFDRMLSKILFVFGFLTWVGGGLTEFERDCRGSQYPLSQIVIVFTAFSAVLFETLSSWKNWDLPGKVRVLYPPVLCLLLASEFDRTAHPFANIGYLVWPIAFAAHYFILWSRDGKEGKAQYDFEHFFPLWLFTGVLAWEAYWFGNAKIGGSDIWALAARDLVLCVVSLAVIRLLARWPFKEREELYVGTGLAPFMAWIILSLLHLNFTHSGDSTPLQFIPILNPLDVLQIIVLVVASVWYFKGKALRLQFLPGLDMFGVLLGCYVFVWLTAFPVRVIHHFGGVPWDFDQLFHSSLVQASLSIFWSLTALALMIVAVRKAWRPIWLAGGALLCVVVLKLVTVDLAGQGTLARVVSFIGTGVLLLVVGYLAPIPPDTALQKEEVKKETV